MTEINDISDLVRVLEENPEWLYTLQGMIISREIAAVPAQLNRLEGKVDNLAGTTYEAKVAQQIASIAGQHLRFGAVRTAHGPGSRRDEDLPDLLDSAFDESRQKANLVNELRRCDLIISGRPRGQQGRQYALFEASITVADHDVHRAARRAAILSQLTGHPAQGVVIGSYIPRAQHTLARNQGVTAITYTA